MRAFTTDNSNPGKGMGRSKLCQSEGRLWALGSEAESLQPKA
jgi:hypothetical protein